MSPFPHPLSLSTHYVSKAVENCPSIVTVSKLNIARSSATLQMTLSQQNRARCVMIGTFGTLREEGISLPSEKSKAPELPPIEKCRCSTDDLLAVMKGSITVAERVKFFTDPTISVLNPSSKNSNSKPLLEGWIEFSDHRPHDFYSSLFFLDCLPPPVINVIAAPWYPTLEYTVHFWADPRRNKFGAVSGNEEQIALRSSSKPNALRCRFSSNHIENSTFYTDGELWSWDGTRLLAKSRQLARIMG